VIISFIVMMSEIKTYSGYYQIDNSIDFGEKRKNSRELNFAHEEVCSRTDFSSMSCSYLEVIMLSN
jgi:hypothetical protein